MLERLEGSQFSTFVRTDLWGWPVALTVHAFGTALVVGLSLIVGLRLLGLFTALPFRALKQIFPAVWAAIAVQVASGLVLWTTKPVEYVADTAFVLKVLFFAAGTGLTLLLARTIARETVHWQADRTVSSRVRVIGAATLIVWCGVLLAGRYIAQLGSL